MDTTIRNLDEDIYRELKAHAARAGRTIGDLVNEAIRTYLARPEPNRPGRSVPMEVRETARPSGKEDRTRVQVDLSTESLAQLNEQAASSGEVGFSELIEKAIDFYLRHRGAVEEEKRIAAAISAIGSFKDEEAERLRESVHRLRETWR